MASFKLPDNPIGREVERLFSEISCQRGSLCVNPVTGVDFVYGVEPIKPQKEDAYRALLAQEWFALNGPADALPLPINERDWSTLKYSRGPMYFLLCSSQGQWRPTMTRWSIQLSLITLAAFFGSMTTTYPAASSLLRRSSSLN